MGPDLDSAPDVCCLPGDITVTRIPSGYLLGRAIEQIGPGPWWEYIAIVARRADALSHARTLAKRDGVKAWLHQSGDAYERIDGGG